MKFTKGQSGNPAGRPKKSPPKPQSPGILSKILITHPDDPPNRKYEMFGRPSIDIMANLLWSAVTNGEARFVHGVLPLSFAEWFELVKWLFDEIDQPPPTADSPALPTSRLREKLIELADDPCIGQSHFDNKNALANMIWCAVYDGLMGTRTGFVHLTAHEWFTLINWVGDHTKMLPEPPTPPEPRSNNPPDPAPDKTGNYREIESEESNDSVLPPPPPPDSPAQTNSNETPDSPPDKTGNYREIESEELNAPLLPPPSSPDSPTQTNSNQIPDSPPDKTGNYREIESEESNDPVLPPPDSRDPPISNQPPDLAPDKTGNYRGIEFAGYNFEYTERPIPKGAYRRATAGRPILAPTDRLDDPIARFRANVVIYAPKIELRTPIPYPSTDPRFPRMEIELDVHPRGWRRLAEWHPPYAKQFTGIGRQRIDEVNLDEEPPDIDPYAIYDPD
jgi:hypothetical protein